MGALAPPRAAHTSTTRCNDFAGIEDLKAAARAILWNCGIDYGPNKVNRLCVQFATKVQGNGFDFIEFLANKVALSADDRRRALADEDLLKVIAYADPTGEAAVDHVMLERGVR